MSNSEDFDNFPPCSVCGYQPQFTTRHDCKKTGMSGITPNSIDKGNAHPRSHSGQLDEIKDSIESALTHGNLNSHDIKQILSEIMDSIESHIEKVGHKTQEDKNHVTITYDKHVDTFQYWDKCLNKKKREELSTYTATKRVSFVTDPSDGHVLLVQIDNLHTDAELQSPSKESKNNG